MDDVYVGFQSYNFNEDSKYQDGLKRLRLTDENSEVLKLKIFYYNRFVRPIELESYLQWSASHKTHDTQTTDDRILELKDKCIQRDSANSDYGEGNSPKETGPEEKRQPISEACTSNLLTSVSSGDANNTQSEEGRPLSFAEVFQLIQAGEAVPGVQELDIRPCQQNPTPSKLTRRLKPWEKSLTAS